MSNKLQQGLTKRNILMIAIGSAIGTGLFFGAGQSIKLAGPAIILAYALGGLMMYIVMRALGEMAVANPHVGSFSHYAYKYIGNYAGFISGWNYWFNYIIVSMLELTATSIFLDYWFPQSIHWLIILVIIILFTSINLLNVKFFGEFEFWFAGIKVLTIILLIIFGLYIIKFDPNTNQASMSNIHNLWQYNGFFATGAAGFLFSLVIVVFSFGGTELVGLAASETQSPEKNIPLAINGIIIRIIFFYIATLTIIMCIYPWNKISGNTSPFVDVFTKIGIAKAASLMNLVAISAALSSFNSGIYGTARMLLNLAQQGSAPKSLNYINGRGVPRNAILFSAIFILITVILNYLYPKQIFNLLLAIATIAAIINWLTILLTHFYFRRQTMNIGYKLPFYPFSSLAAVVFFVIVAIVMSQMKSMKLAIYIAPLWLLILSAAYFIKTRFSGK